MAAQSIQVYRSELVAPLMDLVEVVDCADDFRNKLISAIFYGTCQSLRSSSIQSFHQYLDCRVDPDLLKEAISKVRECIYKTPLRPDFQDSHFLPVRLQGQERLHFEGIDCTTRDYTGDDGDCCCILKTSTPLTKESQRFGYQELSFDSLETQGIYTLELGPCIGILMVGIRKDGTVKAALMHEDYSEPEGCVTNMFKQSFHPDIQLFQEIKVFLIGGNGGETFTQKRFDIHRAEISSLRQEHEIIHLIRSSDELHSQREEFQFDRSNVFFTSIESSSYLWVLKSSSSGCCIEAICVSGPELNMETLALYYRENILRLLRYSHEIFISSL